METRILDVQPRGASPRYFLAINQKVYTLPTNYARFEITLGYLTNESDAMKFFETVYEVSVAEERVFSKKVPDGRTAYYTASPGDHYIEGSELYGMLAPIMGDVTKHMTSDDGPIARAL